MFKNPFRTLKSYKRPTVVKNIYFSLFTSLQSNNDPFVLRSSGDECNQSSRPNRLSSSSGKRWPLFPYFKLYFIAFYRHLRSLRGGLEKSRASRLARVSGTELCQSTLFYTTVVLGGATNSQNVKPTTKPKIEFKFNKMQPIDCKF